MTFGSYRSISKVNVDLERVPFYVKILFKLLLFRYLHTIRSGVVGNTEGLHLRQNPEMCVGVLHDPYFFINMLLPSSVCLLLLFCCCFFSFKTEWCISYTFLFIFLFYFLLSIILLKYFHF